MAGRLTLILTLLIALLPGCASTIEATPDDSVFSGWSKSDLRFLQAPGSDPQHAIVAVYQRTVAADLEIRLDFLDLSNPVDFDVYLALDTQPGGSTNIAVPPVTSTLPYDLLIKIPARGLPAAYDAHQKPMPGILPRSANHPSLDLMTVQLNRDLIPGNPGSVGIQAFLTLEGKNTVISQTPPIGPSTPPPAPAPLLLVFWDTLPAATPVQTLRRWDGAHTGPLGGRHGLNVLLQAAGDQHIPIWLADLKQPASLTGLSFVDGLQRVRSAALRGDAILADPAIGDPSLADKSLDQNQNAGLQAGLPTSPVAFGAFTAPLPAGHSLFLAALSDPRHVAAYQGSRLVPLPMPVYPSPDTNDEAQATPDGLSLVVREQLISAALSEDPGDLVVLGGSLPQSTWGEFSIAPAAFAYVAAHPWMQPLGLTGLQSLPAKAAANWPLPSNCQDLLCTPPVPDWIPHQLDGQPAPSGITLARLQEKLRTDLGSLPDGPMARMALQVYLNLTRPAVDPRLAELQGNALGMVGILNEAARWANQPHTRSDCQADPDFDGLPECILSTPTWMIVLELDGARLVYAARRDQTAIAQWVGPSSQFAVGLGDPSQWNPQAGLSGEPGEIPGAFAPLTPPFETFTAESQPGRIVLRSPDGSTIKTFTISGETLAVDLAYAQPASVELPLTLAPQNWASGQAASAWLPAPSLNAESWSWQPRGNNGLQLQVQGAQIISSASSLDSSSLMATPENPNLAYPAGHYLPYPLALIELRGASIQLRFSPLNQ